MGEIRTREAIIEELSEIQASMDALSEKRHRLLGQLAATTCPFKVGQVVEDWPGISHRGRLVRVTGVTAQDWLDTWTWKATGVVVKKDGSDSRVRATCEEWMFREAKRNP